MTDLQQVLLEECAKMDLKKKCRIKTQYSHDGKDDQYGFNKEEYLKKVNSNIDAPQRV